MTLAVAEALNPNKLNQTRKDDSLLPIRPTSVRTSSLSKNLTFLNVGPKVWPQPTPCLLPDYNVKPPFNILGRNEPAAPSGRAREIPQGSQTIQQTKTNKQIKILDPLPIT